MLQVIGSPDPATPDLFPDLVKPGMTPEDRAAVDALHLQALAALRLGGDLKPLPEVTCTGGSVLPSLPTDKDGNPKDALGATKLPLSLVPATAIAAASLAHLDGAIKYGPHNWRSAGVRASVYVDAAMRHITRWFNGEDEDPDSGLPHLAHALACLNILVDAQACGKLVDDRAPAMPIGDWFASLTPHVQRLKDRRRGA